MQHSSITKYPPASMERVMGIALRLRKPSQAPLRHVTKQFCSIELTAGGDQAEAAQQGSP